MPKLTIEHPHALPLDEVKKRLQALADRLGAKYGIEAKWVSPTEANVSRTGATGKLSCTDSKVSVLLDLSFMLSPMKDKIESKIRDELKSCLT